MEYVQAELINELSRCEDKYYSGVVFIHPDDRLNLITWVDREFECSSVNTQDGIIKLESGGTLYVKTLQSSNPIVQHDYSGCRFSTILIDKDCFGKYDEDFIHTQVNENVVPQEFIMYMITRNRSQADCYSRFVIV